MCPLSFFTRYFELNQSPLDQPRLLKLEKYFDAPSYNAMQAVAKKTADGGSIIVVDDDVAVCKSLKFSLETEGFSVRTYLDGEELLKESAIPDCSCFVIDQRLPGISGIDLIKQLRARRISAPAILITTHPSRDLKQRAEDFGIPIVEKPLLGSILLDGIHQALARRPTRPH